MKKTLIALAVASSAVMSISTMASNGSWGNSESDFNMGGTILVDANKDVWEVYSAPSVNIDSAVASGTAKISLPVTKNIPVLGMRSLKVFNGGLGLTPQITYGNDSYQISDLIFDGSKTEVSLKVKNKTDNQDIGTLKTKMFMAGHASYKNHAESETYPGNAVSIVARNAGEAFYGGVPKTSAEVGSGTFNKIKQLIPDVSEHYDDQGVGATAPGYRTFDNPTKTFSAIYGAGIMAGEEITITLNTPATENINWTAQLPITVSYM